MIFIATLRVASPLMSIVTEVEVKSSHPVIPVCASLNHDVIDSFFLKLHRFIIKRRETQARLYIL